MNKRIANQANSKQIQHHLLHQFKALLKPLIDAGWEYDEDDISIEPSSRHGQRSHCKLTRSCMVVGATWLPEEDKFQFEPAPFGDASLVTPHVLATDMVDKEESIQTVSHGPLRPFSIEHLSAGLGLMDPTRLSLPANAPVRQETVLRELYKTYVGGDAATWHGVSQQKVFDRINNHDETSGLLYSLMLHAPDVIPDPVPRTAAIGLALHAWRNGPVEDIHASDRHPADAKLTDAIMMKLNIAATRLMMEHIALSGVNWLALKFALADPRRALRDGRFMSELFGPKSWRRIADTATKKIEYWQRIESVVGPRATLRLLAVAGSTSVTSRWWGHSWWGELARDVAKNIHAAGVELPNHSGNLLDLLGDLPNDPDDLPDETLTVCLDQPRGQGLRWADVKMPKPVELDTIDEAGPGSYNGAAS